METSKPNVAKIESAVEDPETVIEDLQTKIEAIDDIQELIEQNGEEFIDTSDNTEASGKMQELLNSLQEEAITLWKKITQELSEYSQEVAISFRDKQAADKTNSLWQTINKSKAINTCIKQLDRQQGAEREVEEKANRAFDRVFSRSKRILEVVKNEGFGTSPKHGKKATLGATELLNFIVQKGIALKRDAEVLEAVRIYEQLNTGQTNVFYQTTNHFRKDIVFDGTPEERKQSIKDAYGDDPYLTLSYLTEDRQRNALFISEELDRLIETTPHIRNLSGISLAIRTDLLNYPQKYVDDPSRRRLAFDALKKDNDIKNYSHFFGEELQSMTEVEVMDVCENTGSYDFSGTDHQVFLGSLPLTDKAYKKIYDEKIGFSDAKLPYSKDALFKELVAKGSHGFLLLKHTDFGLDQAQRLEYLKKTVTDLEKHSSNTNSTVLLQLLANFSETFGDLDQTQVQF